MMVAIFECIDRLVAIVRPRKLLYMAIDGVAPRAKMNQQRSRRYRSSKEVAEKVAEIKRIRETLAARGCVLPPEKEKGEHFDSNCITPGTPFMERLSTCLNYYIHDRINNNPAWRNVKVILSDANVPGEGEHKIMDYIRKQRAAPDYDPNLQHVLCGADADLIMLGLATHEPNFTIIREEFLPNKPRPCEICSGLGHEMSACQGIKTVDGQKGPDVPVAKAVEFIFVRLCVLKEYLERELEMPNLPFEYNFERVLDDWVFMCFFVGNDFLPHLPSLEIRENAIDRLINLYKSAVYKTKTFLTDSGDVNLAAVQYIMTNLGYVEDQIFRTRQHKEQQFKMRDKLKKKQQRQQQPNFSAMHESQFAPTPLGRGVAPTALQDIRQEAAKFRMQGNNEDGGNDSRRGRKRPHDSVAPGEGEADDDEEEEHCNDEVRLWEAGFKDRYYESKFDVLPENLDFRHRVAKQYVEGLCWVLKYYYQGCVSWNWYFPYHYAPFASDFIDLGGMKIDWSTDTKPFNPLEQLMSVFPTASSSHVPEPWAELMKDPMSPIIDFYPEDFKIDLNGKKFAWQGVALLPFVDEVRLYKALDPMRDKLTDAERKRNSLGGNRLSVGPDCDGFETLSRIAESKDEEQFVIERISGTIKACDENVKQGDIVQSPVLGLPQLNGNSVVTVCFEDPKYEVGFKFPAIKLKGAIDPPRVLKRGEPRPMTGMVYQQWNQGAQVGRGGHRMVSHQIGGNNRQSGYNTAEYDYNQGRQGGGGGGRGGYNNNNQGGGGGSGYGQRSYNNNSGGYGGGGGYNRDQRGSHSNQYQQNRYGGVAQSGGQQQYNQGGQGGGYQGHGGYQGQGGGNRGYRGGRGGGGYGQQNNYQNRY